MSAPRVLVIGGGVIGCSLAYHLAGAGCSVTLLERGRIGAEASGAAAGILAPLAESAAPGPFLELAVAGLRTFQEDAAAIEANSGLRIEYVPSGVVRPAEDAAHAVALQAQLSLASRTGLPARWLGPDGLRELEPGLAGGFAGGLYSPEEGHVRPARLAAALAHGAVRRGATLLQGMGAAALERRGGAVVGAMCADGSAHNAEVVVLAGGAWSGLIAGSAGVRAPVHPVRGQYVLLRALPLPVRRVVYRPHAYVVPRVNGSLYVGATEEPEAGYRTTTTASAQQGLLAAAVAMVPALGGAELIAGGAGLRPGTDDGTPLLGWAPSAPGLAVAAGHFRNGVLLSLITGRLLTELLVHGRTSMDLAPFSPARLLSDGAVAGRADAARELDGAAAERES